jgi:hypothetical protein
MPENCVKNNLFIFCTTKLMIYWIVEGLTRMNAESRTPKATTEM